MQFASGRILPPKSELLAHKVSVMHFWNGSLYMGNELVFLETWLYNFNLGRGCSYMCDKPVSFGGKEYLHCCTLRYLDRALSFIVIYQRQWHPGTWLGLSGP